MFSKWGCGLLWSPVGAIPAYLHLVLRPAAGGVREDELGLVAVRHQPVQVVAELLQGRVEGHFVGGARQLRAAGRRRRHHPHVLATPTIIPLIITCSAL